jgi:hypothetical protein
MSYVLVTCRPRVSKHGKMVSNPLPWYVAEALKYSSATNTKQVYKQFLECRMIANELRPLERGVLSNTRMRSAGVSTNSDHMDRFRDEGDDKSAELREVAEIFWRRRAGIITDFKSYNKEGLSFRHYFDSLDTDA